jgi:signal transduction histidine kinase
MSLVDFLEKYGKRKPDEDDQFNKLVQSIRLPLDSQDCILVETVRKGQTIRVKKTDLRKDLHNEIYQKLQLEEFVSVPLIVENEVIGVIVADNLYSDKPIDESRVTLLNLFANQAAIAVERTHTYKNMAEQKSALERALIELRRTQKQLIHSERLATVGKMAAHVAHEIRNPLVTIGGFANSMLKGNKSHQDIRETAGIITNEVRRLEKILSNVLDFSRVPKPNFKRANINEVIISACHLIEEETDTSQIHCTKTLDDSIPEFYFDPEQIKQVMLNILRNAIQSLNKAGGSITIKSQHVNEQEIEVQISDTGSGVRKEMLDNIFNPFFTTRPDGTGLGLAICQQIISDHGGLIRAESELGVGTTFYFTLPLRTLLNTDGMYSILTEQDKEELLHF